jgi:hypothetical protein
MGHRWCVGLSRQLGEAAAQMGEWAGVADGAGWAGLQGRIQNGNAFSNFK